MISNSTPSNKPMKARDIEERSPDQIAKDNASNADNTESLMVLNRNNKYL